MTARICIVGSGFSGAVLARELSDAGYKSLVIDERPHLGGNSFTERDARTGVMVHRYGPHIFHTDSEEVWAYVNRYGEIVPYVNRVKGTVDGKVYSLPVNLHTINQFFDAAFTPEEARAFIRSQARSDIEEPANFEEQALKFVGDRLYRAFFYGYTCKQWGTEPANLPASILKRLPLRFNYDDNYYAHKYQGMPRHGYTAIIESILQSGDIELRLNCRFEDLDESFSHIFYTGPLDRYFGYEMGDLGYRTLDFEPVYGEGDLQGVAVMNYGEIDVPYTRVAEHKHFAPWEAGDFAQTVAFREYSRACTRADVPYYPIRLVEEKDLLRRYVERAEATPGITFMGRLGTYQYLDMDATILRALETARAVLPRLAAGEALPSFVHAPL